ncbi:phosphoglycerate mutase [Leptobacterium flavescens]|uniref:Phosphoglycerate mutase n=1 Tax=Leptobacterium flavescens TaxID=472055 RepID=A0A6P0ULD3_9FLAO|nr:phosphoglycerate mutase family protein [Leptobacterium flavescens]NER13332.1 phosphoglycerate mutase [Leptobacterium flavescens]
MKKLILLLLLCTYCFTGNAQESANSELTTYYFIRHAEKDRTDPNNRNPTLTQDGLSRALKWAETFKNVRFDAVYSTNYERTKQTAAPTAHKNKLEVSIYDPRGLDLKSFLAETKGKTVLVVGHSNTTPAFVNGILGNKKYEQIDDSNNANLYIVTLSGDQKSSNLLYIN